MRLISWCDVYFYFTLSVYFVLELSTKTYFVLSKFNGSFSIEKLEQTGRLWENRENYGKTWKQLNKLRLNFTPFKATERFMMCFLWWFLWSIKLLKLGVLCDLLLCFSSIFSVFTMFLKEEKELRIIFYGLYGEAFCD